MKKVLCQVSGQSRNEEWVNVLTHFTGLLLSIFGLTYLLHLSFEKGNASHVFSSLIFGGALVLLYGASTFYHIAIFPTKKNLMKQLDHISIYILIAASYTPFSLGPLKDHYGFEILTFEWILAFFGILLKVFAIHRFQIFSLFTYLAMGWLVIFSFENLTLEMSESAVFWLVTGGLSYTLGTIFYVVEKIPYNHGIWHLFVLFGSFCHFVSVCHLID